MAADDMSNAGSTHLERDPNRRMYQGMMNFGFHVLAPVGAGVTLFFTLLLLGTHGVVAAILGLLGVLGVRGITKTFFDH